MSSSAGTPGPSEPTATSDKRSVKTKSGIPRHRRHSDSQSRSAANSMNSVVSHGRCCIHEKPTGRDGMLLYQLFTEMELSANQCQIPDQIRALHKNHVCSNAGKSRSMPTSKYTSQMTTPLSTPSTPTDSRRVSFNCNQTPTPSRPRSSLSVNSQTNRSPNQKSFAEYMPLCEVQKGLQKGEIVEGVLRINPRNYKDAYISAPEGGLDIYVGGMIDRNRALNGDKVAILLNEPKEFKLLFDVIRIHWDDWEQELNEKIFEGNQSSNTTQLSISSCAQTSAQNELIPIEERDESCDTISISNDNLTGDTVANVSDCENLMDENVSTETKRVTNDKTNKKKKKKRSRKKKTDPNATESTEACDKPQKSIIKSVKYNSLLDDMSLKIKQLQGMDVNKLVELSFAAQFVQKTGQVVHILEANHPRIAGGKLEHMKEKNQNWALFRPNDSRIPVLRVAMQDCPPDFYYHPNTYAQSLFIAEIVEWKTTDTFPNAKLKQHLGEAGDIEAESELILLEHKVETEDFPPEAYYGLPNLTDDEWTTPGEQWSIPKSELQYRRDFRSECVFTIDPSTARDLDDALSVKAIGDQLYEIGVHIADVSYFLKEQTALDEIAKRRATSVYLVQKVIPMLPRLLCEKLCSLNPGEDKLTFSVVWIIDRSGTIVEEWFGRTMIRSCIKLSYELAQEMIDDPNRQWNDCELPAIDGNWNYQKISESVNLLNQIAVKLRTDRFAKGALKIEKLKLHFVLDKESGLPSAFAPYLYRDSNRLVEEFMLLANIAVAQRIYKHCGDKAFLRCHPQPSEDNLKDFHSFCKYNGFRVDTSSSLALRESLDAIINNDPNVSRVVAHFLLKTMQPAQYLCVGAQSAHQTLHHYALSVPLYTHFTSPIRRYADVIVHRLLAASLSYSDQPVISATAQDLYRIAKNCNDRKQASRLVSESSSRLFLNIYLKQIGKTETKAIVVQVYDHSFDVMVLNCGILSRVYLDKCPLKQFVFETKHGKNELILEWSDPEDSRNRNTINQTIIACQIVTVQVSISDKDSSQVMALLRHPNGNFYKKTNERTVCTNA